MQDKPPSGGPVSPRARQLLESLDKNPIDLDRLDQNANPELHADVHELLDADLARIESRDGRELLKRTAVQP